MPRPQLPLECVVSRGDRLNPRSQCFPVCRLCRPLQSLRRVKLISGRHSLCSRPKIANLGRIPLLFLEKGDASAQRE
jgi:hypothetical protein